MAAVSPASRLVTDAAREVLRPLGLRRLGRSRTWVDDHGWWLGVVEFQPSSWSQGSYLNVGAMWLWDNTDHVAFHTGGREAGHEPFRSEAQFQPLAMDLARLAADRVTEYRERFSSLRNAARHLTATPARRGHPWDDHHAGITAGLTGDVPTARDRLTRAARQLAAEDIPWMVDAHRATLRLRDLVDDTGALRSWAAEQIASCRHKLRLEPRPTAFPEDTPGAAQDLEPQPQPWPQPSSPPGPRTSRAARPSVPSPTPSSGRCRGSATGSGS
ncbi:hypothetical protein ACFS5L_11845 [Streptomyces phyllanthi]|uniref:DUF4304 domain-containing protein n=1 Tax=Streptomyces phyllanthi TaxID=1803180 RepID=A0A5N8WBC5_9ACTN|nr:hypothetical protein [Streptomyces phyllanthi]MPY43728.1 hypothetical protein [Streptomyces phyllanthi]